MAILLQNVFFATTILPESAMLFSAKNKCCGGMADLCTTTFIIEPKSRTVKSPGFGVELKYAKHQLYARLYVIGAAISTGAPPQC